MGHTLASLFAPYEGACSLHGAVNIPLSDILYDSRRLSPASTSEQGGVLFFALPGIHADGTLFIAQALENGARAFVCEAPLEAVTQHLAADVGCALVPRGSIRKIMAEVSARFFDYPAQDLTLCAVTGTDGKSTSVEFIHQLLTQCGIRAGLWSTVHCFDGTRYFGNDFRQSTPEAPDLHRAMRRMKNNQCTHAVLEVTSHALSNKTMRVHGIAFDCAALTNVESEHLDFHGTLKQYAYDKSTLFAQVKSSGTALMREDEPYAELFASRAREASARLASYCVREVEDKQAQRVLRDDAVQVRYALENVSMSVHEIRGDLLCDGAFASELRVPCTGLYNAENALLAVSAVHALGIAKLEALAAYAHKLTPPRGRMHTMQCKGVTGIVDYAHTPGSFQKLLPMLRSVVKKRLIVVFGSAGERDVKKRAVQGGIADKYADVLVLTDEDPRAEAPMDILREIAAGATRDVGETLLLIPDRKQAIHRACALAREGDCVLCLGKGHEKSIEYANATIDWDEIAVLEEALKAEL